MTSASTKAARWAHKHAATYAEAAARFAVSRRNIIRVWKQLGFPPRRLGRPHRGGLKAVLWLRSQPSRITFVAAAKKFGITRSAVSHMWARLGYKKRKAGRPRNNP